MFAARRPGYRRSRVPTRRVATSRPASAMATSTATWASADHSNVRLVDWAALVDREPETLAFDTVHGTPEGYARRAEETAAAVRRCPAG